MPGCDVTRRDILRWTAVALASPIALRSDLLGGVAAASGRRDEVSPVNLELVTLAEDHAVVTWYTGYTGSDDELGRMRPAPADGEVHWGTHPDRLRRIAGERRRDTPYHHVELTGLEPGQTYYYQAFSNGKPALPMPFTLVAGNAVGTSDHGLATGGPYSFTTPQPPPGRFLFAIALCNDLHMGETVAGRSGSIPELTGIEQVPGRPPYPEVMLESLVRDTQELGAEYLLAAGDISAEAVPVDLSRAGQLLRQFGKYQRDYFVVRGNHDRAHTGDAWAACRVGEWGGNDCFHDRFFPGDEPTYFRRDLQGLRVIGIDTYDKPGRGSEPGLLSPAQLAWFRSELADERDQPTVVFGHHPLVVESSAFPTSPSSALDVAQAQMILADYSRTPGVFLHHAGHTHRNKRTTSPAAPDVLHQEVAAVKEYPGGFSLLRLHTGGYAVNFYKTRSELSREWSERSRQQVLGFWPQFALGAAVSDRNTVVERDLSGLRRGRARHDSHRHGRGRDRDDDRRHARTAK
jgi:3',5'-cyclic-AMP phosphodiesterase